MTKPVLISLRECAKQLSAAGDAIKNPALGRYVKRYELKRGTGPRRSVLVDFAEVQEHRKDNFTREWMRGGAAAQKISSNGTAQAGSAEPIRDSADTSENVVPLDRAREAKTTREEALAQQELLNLEERLKNLIPLDEAEAGNAIAADALRDVTQGSPASDFADSLLATFKLPSKLKRELLTEVKKYGASLQAALAETLTASVTALSKDSPSDVQTRSEYLAELAYLMRHNPAHQPRVAQFIAELKSGRTATPKTRAKKRTPRPA